MIPDRLQYVLEHFWNDQKCDRIWTFYPRIYRQNTSINTGKLWGGQGTKLEDTYFGWGLQ